MASRKRRVPELAMLPMLATTSSRDMPMPVSRRVIVRACLSQLTSMRSSASPASSSGLAIDSKRSLSQASEALEISSRRKISLCEYSECVTRCRTWATSASKARVSVVVVMESVRMAWTWRRGYARAGTDFKLRGRRTVAAVASSIGPRPAPQHFAQPVDPLHGDDIACVADVRERRVVRLDQAALAGIAAQGGFQRADHEPLGAGQRQEPPGHALVAPFAQADLVEQVVVDLVAADLQA